MRKALAGEPTGDGFAQPMTGRSAASHSNRKKFVDKKGFALQSNRFASMLAKTVR